MKQTKVGESCKDSKEIKEVKEKCWSVPDPVQTLGFVNSYWPDPVSIR